MKKLLAHVCFAVLTTVACSVSAQEILDHFSDATTLSSPSGFFTTRFSGLFDLEGYYIDQRPPGLLFQNHSFVNPRLTMFLDTDIGKHVYIFVQARADRGFDPGAKVRDARADEYFLRYTPLDDSRVHIQVGKFATVVGNYVARHFSWDNPFINAPLPYENVTSILDQYAADSPQDFLMLKNFPDDKRTWVPVIWGPSYATGASVGGSIEKFDYAAEVKNASLSSRPAVWDAQNLGFNNPTISARVGYRPTAAWNIGISGSGGSYLLPVTQASLNLDATYGTGTKATFDQFNQYTFGHDISYSHGHWETWAEVFFSRFEVPNVGNAETVAYYVESKYKFTPKLYGALRWNQQLFGSVDNGSGGKEPWDRQIWRVDSAVGYRFTRHMQGKLQYSFSEQQGHLQQGQQLVAGQLTLKF